jgi:hypothetical protein
MGQDLQDLQDCRNQRLAAVDRTAKQPRKVRIKVLGKTAMKFSEGKAQGAAQPCGSKVPFNG